MRKLLLSLLFIGFSLFINAQNKYETVDKNRHFREQVNTGNFLKLSNGYTYYEIKNEDSINTLIFIPPRLLLSASSP